MLDRQLVGCKVVGDRCTVLAVLQVRAVTPDADDDLLPVCGFPDRDRVDLPRVDLAEMGGDVLFQSPRPTAAAVSPGLPRPLPSSTGEPK